jgi:DHA3 family macrolide efflux protein-like MFS transporter
MKPNVKSKRPTGMRGFTLVCAGQAISLLGTAMSNFGLTLWAYEITGKATPLALIGLFFTLPIIISSPFIGVLVDRGNRKLLMMVSDLAAAFTTLVVLILYATHNLQIWHLYVTAIISGTFQGFQWPTYSAAISTMLPKEQYARANGMLGLVGSGSGILAPMLAGVLIGPIGLGGLFIIDLVSAAVAVGSLAFVHIPQPTPCESDHEGQGSFMKEAAYGIRYILERPSLLGLQSIFMLGNLFFNLSFVLLSPMILGRTGNNELTLGSVQSAGAVGGLVGGLLITAWGGPKRRIFGVLLGWLFLGLLGQITVGLGQGLPVWACGAFLAHFFGVMIDSSNQAIWQAKVAPDVQGRVFSMRRFIAHVITPIGSISAGPLADRVLEPALAKGGWLVPVFGNLVGTGTGAGMALLFVFGGMMVALTAFVGSLIPAIRNVERILPDHDALEG